MRTIEIQGVEATALKQLVDYCYTGEENTLKLSIRSFIAPTSLPYFRVKLRKKIAYSYPRVTYSYPKVA